MNATQVLKFEILRKRVVEQKMQEANELFNGGGDPYNHIGKKVAKEMQKCLLNISYGAFLQHQKIRNAA